MPARRKVKVQIYGAQAKKTAMLEDGATHGATIGADLHLPDGSIPTLAQLAAALGVGTTTPASGLPLSRTIWGLIQEIPANVVEVAELATSGIVVRQASGNWLTRSIEVASTARLTIANGDGDAGAPTLDMADIAAVSVWGRSANSIGKPAAIVAGANDRLLTRVADAVAFTQLTAGMFPSTLSLATAFTISGQMILDGASDPMLAVRRTSGTASIEVAGTVAGSAQIYFVTAATLRGLLAAPGQTNAVVTGSAVGDIVLRAESGRILFTRDGGTTIAAQIGPDDFTVFGTDTTLTLIDTNAASDEKVYWWRNTGGIFELQTRTDVGGLGATPILIDRVGTTVTLLDLTATAITLAGAVEVTGRALFSASYSAGYGVQITAAGDPGLEITRTSAAADTQKWAIEAGPASLIFYAVNDARSVFTAWLVVARTTTTIDSIALTATAITLNGAVTASGLVDALTYEADGAGGGGYGWDNDPDTFIARPSANTVRITAGGASTADFSSVAITARRSVIVTNDTPEILWQETDAAANNQWWSMFASGEQFRAVVYTDAFAATNWLTVDRAGVVVDLISLFATSFLVFDGATALLGALATSAGETALRVYDHDNAALERVTVGAADSGGTGFKVLRIPN